MRPASTSPYTSTHPNHIQQLRHLDSLRSIVSWLPCVPKTLGFEVIANGATTSSTLTCIIGEDFTLSALIAKFSNLTFSSSSCGSPVSNEQFKILRLQPRFHTSHHLVERLSSL